MESVNELLDDGHAEEEGSYSSCKQHKLELSFFI